jgi:hypothetical protein
MTWDATNSRLGIGTNAPAVALDARTSANSGTELIRVTNSSTGSSATAALALQANVAYGALIVTSSTYTPLPFIGANAVGFYSTHKFVVAVVSGDFGIGTGSSLTERFRLFGSTGNLLLQNGGTFTDSGERLQVTGDVKITGSGATFATTALLIQNSSSTQLLRLTNDGALYLGASSLRAATTSTNIGVFLTGSSAFLIGGTNSTNFQNTSSLLITRPYAPTSGSVQHNAIDVSFTINQTGGANGITRGLYVNPTLTAAADFRAIETARGNVVFGNLPTSSAGLPTGAIWNDAGTIKIV